MKPNYQAMTKIELRNYILKHKEDIEAIRLLFHTPDNLPIKHYPPVSTEESLPIEGNIKIIKKAIKAKIEEKNQQL